jgi:3-phenylpropionate/trans-cinnamate dioxygenase ferredoxin subunit
MPEVVVAKSAELLVGAMRSVEVGAKRVVVFRSNNGSVSALEDRCSHAEVRLSSGTFEPGEGPAGVGEVVCPAHGARFNVCTGKHLCMPAVTGVKVYTVVERNGEIVLSVP